MMENLKLKISKFILCIKFRIKNAKCVEYILLKIIRFIIIKHIQKVNIILIIINYLNN